MNSLNNYKVLFSLRILKSILESFVDSFLVLYFLTLSNHNILPFGIYKVISLTIVFFTIFSLRRICESKYRIHLLRIGILLDFLFFLTIILLKDHIIDYIYLVGILYGLEEGFYYSVYNIFESDGISNKERANFIGTYTTMKSILAILFPILFGSLIATTGFLKSIVIVLMIIIIRIVLSFQFKDINVPENNETDIQGYMDKVKSSKILKQMNKVEFCNGLTYSSGAFKSIVTIYIIKVFSDSFSLGIFTSIFSLISCILGLLFAKKIKIKDYPIIIRISMIFTIVSLCVMVIKCNMITIVLFNFFQTISNGLVDLINNSSIANISNLDLIGKEYKFEYFLGNEFFLFIGRVISNSLLIWMAFINSTFVILVLIFFLIMLMINSIRLQEYTKMNNENGVV